MIKIEKLTKNSSSERFKICIPFKMINLKVEKKIIETIKTFRMPGFREGKVPISIVKQKIEKKETEKEIHNIIPILIKDIVKLKNIIPYSKPDIKILSFNEVNGLFINIILETLPEIPDIKWDEIEINKINLKVSDTEIKKTKHILFKEFLSFEESQENDKVELCDKVKINFYAKIENKDFDGNRGDNIELIVGEDAFLNGFDTQLLNCKFNEKKTFKIRFSHNYPKKEIANKEAEFTIKIVSLKKLHPIEKVSDAMLAKVGMKSEEELNTSIKQKLSLNLLSAVRLKMKKDIFDIIDAKYNFNLPQKIIEQDATEMLNEIKKNQKNLKSTQYETNKEEKLKYTKIAKRRIKLGLILASVIRKNNITITNTELNQIIELQIKQHPELKNRIKSFYNESNNLERIKGPILEEKALDYIFSKVKMKNINMTTDYFTKHVIHQVKQ